MSKLELISYFGFLVCDCIFEVRWLLHPNRKFLERENLIFFGTAQCTLRNWHKIFSSFALESDTKKVVIVSREKPASFKLCLLIRSKFKVWRTSCFPPAFEFWTVAEVGNDVVKGAKIQISEFMLKNVLQKQIHNLAPFSTSLPTSAEECQKFKITLPHFEIENVNTIECNFFCNRLVWNHNLEVNTLN